MDSKFAAYIQPGIPFADAASFYLSMKQAEATDPPDETGLLEGQFKAPVEAVLNALLQQVKREFETLYAYKVYAQTLRDMTHDAIAEHFNQHADDELGHAEYLLKRVAVLGGPAHAPDLVAPHPSSDPIDIIKTMIRMEQEGIAGWHSLIELVGDNPMKVTMESYMAAEQEHLDDLWQLLPYTAKPTIIDQPKVAAGLSNGPNANFAHQYTEWVRNSPQAAKGVGRIGQLLKGSLVDDLGNHINAGGHTAASLRAEAEAMPGAFGIYRKATADNYGASGELLERLRGDEQAKVLASRMGVGAGVAGLGAAAHRALTSPSTEEAAEEVTADAAKLSHLVDSAVGLGVGIPAMAVGGHYGAELGGRLGWHAGNAMHVNPANAEMLGRLSGGLIGGSIAGTVGHRAGKGATKAVREFIAGEDEPREYVYKLSADANSLKNKFTNAVGKLFNGKKVESAPGVVMTAGMDPNGVRRGNDLEAKFVNGDALKHAHVRMKLAFDQMAAGASPELQQYLQNEAVGQQVQHDQEVQYYQGQAQQVQQENEQLQGQLSQVQQQASELQQQVQQTQDQLSQMAQQSQQVQQVAMQSATQANQIAAQANIQHLQAQQDALMHKQLSANMRSGVAQMKEQLAQSLQSAQQALAADPTMGVEVQLASGAQPQPEPNAQMPQQAADPNAQAQQADPNAQQPQADPNAQQPAKTAGWKDVLKDMGTEMPNMARTALQQKGPELLRAAPYAAVGAALGAGTQYLTHGADQTGKLRQAVTELEARSAESPSFGTSMALAKQKMHLALSEMEDKHPYRSAMAAGSIGATTLGAMGPQITDGIRSLAKSMPTIKKVMQHV